MANKPTDRLEQLADQLAALIAKGSSDYGHKRNTLKQLFIDFAKEVKRSLEKEG